MRFQSKSIKIKQININIIMGLYLGILNQLNKIKSLIIKIIQKNKLIYRVIDDNKKFLTFGRTSDLLRNV